MLNAYVRVQARLCVYVTERLAFLSPRVRDRPSSLSGTSMVL